MKTQIIQFKKRADIRYIAKYGVVFADRVIAEVIYNTEDGNLYYELKTDSNRIDIDGCKFRSRGKRVDFKDIRAYITKQVMMRALKI